MKIAIENASWLVTWPRDLPVRTQRALQALDTRMVLHQLLARPDCHPSIIREELDKERGFALTGLAGNPALKLEHQEELLATGNNNVIDTLGENPGVDVTIAERILAEHPARRGSLAWNAERVVVFAPSEPTNHRSYETLGFARWQQLPRDLQVQWSQSHSVTLRGNLARNPFLDLDVQQRLAEDSALSVRNYLGDNPHLDPAFLDIFTHGGADAQYTAAGSPVLTSSQIDYLIEKGNSDAVQRLAQREDLTLQQQHALAGHGVRMVEELARYAKLDTELQEGLLEEGYVRYLVGNPFLDQSIQDRIVETGEPAFLLALADNHNLSQETYEKILVTGEASGVLCVNPSFEVKPWMELTPILARSPEVERLRTEMEADPETWDALASNWSGTIAELGEACTLVT